jgi:NADPH-dependent ferric siderophore reductase
VRAISVVAVADRGDEQAFVTAARHDAAWVHRPLDRADDPASLLAALRCIELPEGDGFVWIAGEANVARAVRAELVGSRGHPLAWTKAAGYWRKGVANAHEKLGE